METTGADPVAGGQGPDSHSFLCPVPVPELPAIARRRRGKPP